MIPYWIPTVVKFIEAESRLVGARGWGEQNGKMLLNEDRVSVLFCFFNILYLTSMCCISFFN